MISDLFRRLFPDFDRFEQVELIADKKQIGWSVSAIDKSGMAVGGGCHEKLNTARRIAVSESLERKLYAILKRDSIGNSFLLDQYPTTSCL